MPVTITCAHCGKEKSVAPSRANRATVANFCSNECSAAYAKGKGRGWKEEKKETSVSCSQCGNQVVRKNSQLFDSGNVFCSRKCYAIYLKENSPKLGPSEKFICDECGKEYYRSPCRKKDGVNHFCSKACAAKHRRSGRILVNCDACGKEYEVTIHAYTKRDRRYCSEECRHEGQRKNHPDRRILAYSILWRTIAREVRERDNHTCQQCGKYQVSPALDVHHIVPAKDFPLENIHIANDPENLITLCRSCHRKVESDPSLLNHENSGSESRSDSTV